MKKDHDKKKLIQYWKDLPLFFQGRMIRNLVGGAAILLLSTLLEKGLGDFGRGFLALGLIALVYCLGSAVATFYRAAKGSYHHYGGVCLKAETAKAANRILVMRRKEAVQKITLNLEDNSTVELECPGEQPFLEGEYYDCYFSEATQYTPSTYYGCTRRITA